jgi:hypothetical protein
MQSKIGIGLNQDVEVAGREQLLPNRMKKLFSRCEISHYVIDRFYEIKLQNIDVRMKQLDSDSSLLA